MSNDFRGENCLNISCRAITVKISDTQNSLSDFQAFVVSSPVTVTFKQGELYLHSTVLMIGQPTTSATLTLSGSSSASNILVVNLDFNLNFLNNITKGC